MMIPKKQRGEGMVKYVLKRLLMMIPVVLAVILLLYVLLTLAPGDPARIILGEDAAQELVDAKREELGLNDPILIQYGKYVAGIMTKGDFGNSYSTGKPVANALLERFPTTIGLAVSGLLVMSLIGIPIGIISAVRQYSWIDNISVAVGMIGVSMPNFWLGLVLIMFFSLKLGWLPASGFYGPAYWILPAITVGVNSAATLMRTTRSSMLECVRQDYIRTARAKGQKENVVVMHHALRNALIPIITVLGMQFGILLGGAVVIESIFSIPGLGKYIVDSIQTRDYPVVLGGVVLMAICFSLVNLAVDLLYTAVDPRIKTQFQGKKKRKREVKTG